jgi:NADPH:quinone reductase-like Zn-dependent oxidoreductase
MSRVVRFHRTGGPEVLSLDEVEVREPRPGEVRIRTRALGLNRAEAMFRNGDYVVEPVFPALIGYEAAGVVEAVGDGVCTVRVGDHVSVVPAFALTDYGLHGELVVAPARAVVKHPGRLTWNAAAATWMQFITAYGGLIELGNLTAGDSVVVSAASSSVGLAAIQIANMVGAQSIALTRTSVKRDRLLTAGASAVIATTEEDIVSRVLELTGGRGARVTFDAACGPDFAALTAGAADHGVIVLYGVLSADPTPLPAMDVLAKYLTIRGYQLFEFTNDDERLSAAVEFLTKGLESGDLVPIIDKTFALDDIVDAHRYLERGDQIGKIVVTVDQ